MSFIDEIKSINDKPVKTVHVPEWNREVHLRSWSYKETEYVASKEKQAKAKDNTNLMAFVVAFTLSDPNGERVCSDKDADVLSEKHPAVIARLYLECYKHQRLTEDEAKKNLETTVSSPSE
jgi:hypothetical protein